MTWYASSIGKKVLMAVSGLLLLGFVIAHLLGNLLIFAGPQALNDYARHLRELGPILWLARFFLIVTAIVHIYASIQVTRENRAARPHGYRRPRMRETSLAARTMMFSGLLVIVYLIYHLLHFTFRVTHPDISHGIDALGHPNVYAMVVRSFQLPAVSVAYLIGMTAVWMHLMHGIGSAFQTLGLTNERTLAALRLGGRLLAGVLYLGYVSIPLAVLFGVVSLR
ncbi:MAG: succinate dehydrogenase cytochrome b subunit [Candidatus Omnitrophica bacterium]|nr:succinate dehydrogenase cytochrome b subunit [Candidatus Omnitrophota bacterium]